MRMIDRTGHRYHRLLVEHRVHGPSPQDVYWQCRCDCGNTHVVTSRSLRSGHVGSCGCWGRECASRRRSTHRKTHTPEHRSWASAKNRCTNPTNAGYKDYGGRGITMCAEWLNDFSQFFQDMGLKPSAAHTLERIDNNGPYSPQNCRWATRAEQSINRRWCIRVGPYRTVTEAAKMVGIRSETLRYRLRKGWTVERALMTPLNSHHLNAVTFNGKTRNISQWAHYLGMRPQALLHRLQRGWPVERALSEPVHRRT